MPVLEVLAGEMGGPVGLPSLLKKEEKEEDDEEKKEGDNEEEEMDGTREEEGMQDSLVGEEGMMVKLSLVPFATCLLPLQLLQGSFHQEEVKQPHLRDTQRPNIMNYVVPPEAPDHLPLATLPCLIRTMQPLWQELLKKVQPV